MPKRLVLAMGILLPLAPLLPGCGPLVDADEDPGQEPRPRSVSSSKRVGCVQPNEVIDGIVVKLLPKDLFKMESVSEDLVFEITKDGTALDPEGTYDASGEEELYIEVSTTTSVLKEAMLAYVIYDEFEESHTTTVAYSTSDSPPPWILHVDRRAPPGGDGSTWDTAFANLQDALDSIPAVEDCEPDVEIRVAVGRYRPDEAGNVDASFLIPPHVVIRGGYLGLGAADPDSRITSHAIPSNENSESILDGDLAGDDDERSNDPAASFRIDNARHVVNVSVGAAGVVLDGLHIRGGHASIGVFGGGGVAISGGSVEIRDCLFAGCFAAGDGGAILAVANAELRIFDTRIEYCGAGRGAGIWLEGAALVFARGRMRGNAATNGAALDVTGPATVRLSHVGIDGNDTGGGVRFENGVDAKVLNSILALNGLLTGWSGAALDAADSTVLVVNVTIDSNGVRSRDGASVTIRNSILATNPNSVIGGSYLETDNGTIDIDFSIVEDLDAALVTQTLMSWTAGDPLFLDENLALDPASPAVDAGDPAALADAYAAEDDLAGLDEVDVFAQPRDGPPDLGAREAPAGPP